MQNLRKTIFYEKDAQKIFVKLPLLVNFINILRAGFCQFLFCENITNSNRKHKKVAKNTFL